MNGFWNSDNPILPFCVDFADLPYSGVSTTMLHCDLWFAWITNDNISFSGLTLWVRWHKGHLAWEKEHSQNNSSKEVQLHKNWPCVWWAVEQLIIYCRFAFSAWFMVMCNFFCYLRKTLLLLCRMQTNAGRRWCDVCNAKCRRYHLHLQLVAHCVVIVMKKSLSIRENDVSVFIITTWWYLR